MLTFTRRAVFPLAIGLAAVVIWPEAPHGQAQTGTAIALVGARILDGTGAPAIEAGTVIVRDGRIAAAGPTATVQIPTDARRVDLTGKTILPGFVNAHGHAHAAAGSEAGKDLVQRLRTYASFGVTTVVSLGQNDETAAVVRLRDEQAKGPLDRARVYTSGQSQRGLATPAAARAAVETLVAERVDRIKFHMAEGAGAMTPDVYGALIEAAAAKKLKSAAHIFTLDEAKGVVGRGVDIVAHSVRDRDVDAALIAEMKKRNTFYVPTLTRELSVFVYESTPAFFKDPFFLRGLPLYQRDIDSLSDPARQQQIRQDKNAQSIKTALAQATRNLKLLSDAGVPIAFGTDSGAGVGRFQGYFEHVELEMMVQAGMTPMQVLVAATSAAARASGLDHVGTIAAGKAADLLVLGDDPSQDIRNTRQIHSVWIAGRRVVSPPLPYLAIAIFIAVFAIATLRNIHLGALMLPAACVVGVWLAGLSTQGVVSKFPVNILILVAGVTFFFGIAQGNGTIERVVQKLLAAVGTRRGLLPYMFYLITAGIASMGSSQAGYVMIPLAMPAARRSGVHPMVMAVALNSGMSTGGFAPISLFGIVIANAAKTYDIAFKPFALLAVAMAANVALLVVATWLFRGSNPTPARRDAENEPAPAAVSPGFASHHIVTLTCITAFILFVVISFTLPLIYKALDYPELKLQPDIGVIAFGFGALLALLYPNAGAEGIRRIDWSTAFMVGGIVTFVAVLQQLEAEFLLGEAATKIGSPIVAVFVVCMVAGLASAFASTNAILAALVPLAVPLATTGGTDGVTGWALLSAMGVCATIVDASPFSTTGALFVASAADEERRSLKSSLTRWGLWMVLVGPVAAVLLLLLFGLA